jgi:septal ring-binding cell division protein DamX
VLLEQPGYSQSGKRKTWYSLAGNFADMNKFKITIPLLLAVTIIAGYFIVTGTPYPESDSSQSANKTSNKKVYVLARPETVILQRDEQGKVQSQTPTDYVAVTGQTGEDSNSLEQVSSDAASPEPTAPLVGIHGQQSRVLPMQEQTTPPVQHAVEVASTPAPAKAGSKAASWSEHWWRQQNPAHYTVMLLGSHSKQAVLDFIRQQQLTGKAGYFQTRRKDAPWYVVIFGIYPDKQAALQAAAKLPAYPGTDKPWVRSIASVHADMKKLSLADTPAAH